MDAKDMRDVLIYGIGRDEFSEASGGEVGGARRGGVGCKGSYNVIMDWVEVDKGGGWGSVVWVWGMEGGVPEVQGDGVNGETYGVGEVSLGRDLGRCGRGLPRLGRRGRWVGTVRRM